MPVDSSARVLALAEDRLEERLAALFRHFDATWGAAPLQRSCRLADSRVEIRSGLQNYLDLCDLALLSADLPGAEGGRFLVSCSGSDACPELRWSSPFFREREIESALRDTRYRLHFHADLGFWQAYDRESGRGWQIMRDKSGFPAWDPGSPLRNLMHWHLSETGGSLIHAGTLLHAGRGALFAGGGGAGKSGTVIAGILQGLRTVGDDYVGVKPASLRAYPVFKTLKQDEQGVARLGLQGHRAIGAERNWQNKYQFSVDQIGHGVLADSIPIDVVLLPRVTGHASTRFEPVSAIEAFLALAPSGVSQIPGDRTVQARAAATLLRQVPSYCLWLGTKPSEIVAALCEFLENL